MILDFIGRFIKSLDPFDRLTLAYLSFLNALILLFSSHLEFAPTFFIFHIIIAAACIALSRAAKVTSSRAIEFLHAWSPLALFLFFFEELQHLVHIIHAGWFDSYLISFDYALFGVHPTVWLERFASPITNDAMQFAYMTYYLYAVILGALLYRQKDFRSLRALMTASAAAYYIGYVISILFPIEGPFYTLTALQSTDLRGGFFTTLIGHIERFGRVHGAAFPSAHVSGSTVALLAAWHFGFRCHRGFHGLGVTTRFVETLWDQSGGAQRLPPCRRPMRSPHDFGVTEHSRLGVKHLLIVNEAPQSVVRVESRFEKSARRLFWVFLPFYFAMLVATVFGRYHYFADVLAGILTGLIGFRIGFPLCVHQNFLTNAEPHTECCSLDPLTL